MSAFLLLLCVVAGSILFLGLYVFFKNHRSRTNQSYFLITFFTTAWIISNYLAENAPSNILFWNRLTFTAVILLASTFAYFAYVFNRKSWKLTITKFVVFLFAPLAFALISLSNFVVFDVSTEGNTVGITQGSGYYIFVLYFSVYIISGLWLFFQQLRKSVGAAREAVRLLFMGLLGSLVFGVFTNLVYPILTGQHHLSKFGPFGVSFLVIASAYSIIRYRLLDIRFAARVIIIKLLLTLVIGLLGGGVYVLTRNRIDLGSSSNVFLIIGVASLLIILLYEPINRFLRSATDKFLFQKEYSHQALIRDLGKIMASSVNLDEVLQNIQDTLMEVMRVEYVGFVLWSREHDRVGNGQTRSKKELHTWGFGSDAPRWTPQNIIIQTLGKNRTLIVFDELLREISEMRDSSEQKAKEHILEAMREFRAGVVVPLFANEGYSGVVVLGEKKGGDAFTVGDINTLEALMYQAGIAIANASLFAEVQAFNIKLRKEVARATEDLALKNKNLTILRHLDQVILSSRGIKEMSQKIVDTISWELGHRGGLMVLLEKSKNQLHAVAFSNTPIYKKISSLLPLKLTDYVLPLNKDESNYLIRAVKERKPFYTSDFKDLYVPAIPADLAEKIQVALGAHHNLVYPLIAKDEVLGVLIFDLNKPFKEFDQHERSLLETFMDEAGIAVNNAILYEELQDLNERLRNANQRLRDLDQMKDELVSVASHELRTPLTSIKGYLWMALNRQKSNLNPKLEQYLQRSYDSSERLIDLVNDMLSVSRLEGKRVTLEQKPLNLVEFIPSILDDLMPKALEKGLKLTFEKPKEKIPQANADETRLREIMMNLVGNALKFTEKGRVWVTVKAVPAHQEGIDLPMVQVDVHDTGKGIRESDKEKLFTKFGKLQQGSFVKSSEEGGTGLGLYITKRLVELHGGTVWAEGKPGEGTTFSFTIPQA